MEVSAGQTQDGWVEIKSGLSSGQRVVTSGQFLIDSEASLQSALPQMDDLPETPDPVMDNSTATPVDIYSVQGEVNAINGATITLSHGPIAALKWGAMTMDFLLPPGDLSPEIRVGSQVNFTFTLSDEGAQIRHIKPVKTNNSTDIAALDQEFKLLAAENTRVAAATTFNGTAVIAATTFTFQVGANNTAANDQIAVTGAAFSGTSSTLGATTATAFAEISKLDTDINNVTTARSTWGATQNRFDSVITNLRVGSENSAAARGRILDADYAMETASLSRAQVLQQAGTAMVAQANQAPQSVLALLR